MNNIIELFHTTASQYPDKTAAICEGKRYTYAELETSVQRLSASLRESWGVGPGDRVAILMPNCAEFVICYLSIVRTGATALPVNIRLKPPEIQFILDDAGARVLVAHPQTWRTVQPVLGDLPKIEHVMAVGFNDPAATGYEQLLSRPAPALPPPALGPEDVPVIIYTSGTTGLPKGAMLMHKNLIFNARSTLAGFGFEHDETHLIVVPLFHVTGLNSILITSLMIGSTIVISANTRPRAILDTIAASRANTFFGVPTTYVLFLATKGTEQVDLSSARIFVYSGALMPPDTIRRLRECFPHVALTNLYGLTETTSVTTVLPAEDALRRIESVGKPVPSLQVQTLDERDQPAGPGQIGELCVKADSVFKGYYGRPEASEAAFVNGWFRTGDNALIDDEGYVFLKGRKTEMIIVAGENVYPVEVENAICSHPQVLEAAAIGLAHPVMGQVVKAVVVTEANADLTESDIKRHCANRLASYKVPQAIDFIDQLPRNPSGKVVKRMLE